MKKLLKTIIVLSMVFSLVQGVEASFVNPIGWAEQMHNVADEVLPQSMQKVKSETEDGDSSATEDEKDLAFVPSAPLIYIDGVKSDIKVLSYEEEAVVFVPVEMFCDEIGADVYWDKSAGVMNITYNGNRITIEKGADVGFVNGYSLHLTNEIRRMSGKLAASLDDIALLTGCDIVNVSGRGIYVLTGAMNIFDNNLFNICDDEGRYFAIRDGQLQMVDDAGFDTMWLFDTVDREWGLYSIYNFCQADNPLSIKAFRYEGPYSFGSSLSIWKVTAESDGSYSISPEHNTEYYLDITRNLLTTKPVKVYLKTVSR